MLSTLCAWACRPARRYMEANPVAGIEPIRIDRVPPAWLLPAEYAQLQAGNPELADVLDFLVATGLRASEFCNLRREDLRGDCLLIRERKARDWSVIPCDGGLRLLLLSQRSQEWAWERAGCPWTRDHLYQAVHAAGLRIGLQIGPHTLRHTAASWSVAAGVPIRDVQRLLGHSTVTTTERYAHASQALKWERDRLALPARLQTIVPIYPGLQERRDSAAKEA